MVSLARSKTPFSAPLEIRYVGVLDGRYTFTSPTGNGSEAEVYACRTSSLSPQSVVVVVPVQVPIGQKVTLLLDHVGFLKGTVIRQVVHGFEVELIGSVEDQEKLAAKINWLKKHRLRMADNKRVAARRRPRKPMAFFYLDDGTEHECLVTDISVAGAGLSSRAKPPVGTQLVLGAVRGTVVRHIDTGFGVNFEVPCMPDTLEASIATRRAR